MVRLPALGETARGSPQAPVQVLKVTLGRGMGEEVGGVRASPPLSLLNGFWDH
jgi:hypothetical protein